MRRRTLAARVISGRIVSLTLALLIPASPCVPVSADTDPLSIWISGQEDWFSTHPELMTSGTGWKPYQRIRWFTEERRLDGELPAPGSRWAVWLEKQNRASAGSAPWFSLGPTNISGRALALAHHPTDPNVVYVGSASGGLWKTTDAGQSWIPLTDHLPTLGVGGVALLPSDPDVVILGTGEGTPGFYEVDGVGILLSTDAGATWNATSLSYPVGSSHGFHVVEANPYHDTILAGANDGLWRSSDGGWTWTAVRTGGDFYDVKWKPGDPDRVYSAKGSDSVGNNVKVSTDDGLTWTKAGDGQPASVFVGKTKIALSAADPSTVYAIFADLGAPWGLLGVYRSADDGANWAPEATTPDIPGGQGWYNLSLVADPDDPTHLLAGGVELYESTDSGASFTQIGAGVHVDHHDARYESGSATNLWVATDGGVWRSTDDGATWVARNTGLVTHQFYDVCPNDGPDPYYVLGGTQDNGTDKWTGGTTWDIVLGGDGMVCVIDPTNGTRAYVTRPNGNHHRSSSSGDDGTWQPILLGLSGVGDWITPLAHDPSVSGRLFTAMSTGIFRTLNSGNFWSNVASHDAKWISISPVDGDVVWTVSSTAHLSTDGGDSWQPTTAYGFPTGTATKILADPFSAGTAFVTFSGYGQVAHVARTTDFGSTWTDVTGDFPSQPVNTIAVDPERRDEWYVGTDVGVWLSTDRGSTWLPADEGLPNTVVNDLEIKSSLRKLVAGTYGRGGWEMNLPPGDVSAPLPTAGSRSLLLDPPHPNPARDQVVLRFAARSSSPVSLDLYDVTGRIVARIEERTTGDGIVRATRWHVKDLPNGVYFAVLSTGRERVSRKLTVLR